MRNADSRRLHLHQMRQQRHRRGRQVVRRLHLHQMRQQRRRRGRQVVRRLNLRQMRQQPVLIGVVVRRLAMMATMIAAAETAAAGTLVTYSPVLSSPP